MNQHLFSPHWYRVADLHPHLRAEVKVQRQQARDRLWHLLVDTTNGRQYRLNHNAYQFIGRCNGQRSVSEIWDGLLDQLQDDAPTQEDVIRVLDHLDEQGLLASEAVPDAEPLVRRRDERARRRQAGFVNPFALRIPLGNPSRLLEQLDRFAPMLFNPLMLCAWMAAVVAGILLAAENWQLLAAHTRTYMDSPRYTLLTCASFPFIKALHELGHAVAVRRWGGQVPSAGVTLFLLIPAPYVDASAAAAFPSRHQRLTVSAAGMMVELLLAVIALCVWLNVQPGLVRDLAFVILFISSVSTILFNGNPLLTFDAYYMLCDAFALPNLASRSKAWWTGVTLRALAGKAATQPFQLSRGEAKWMLLYGPLSFVYRIFVACLLILWLGTHSAVLAAIAFLLLAGLLIIKPLRSVTARMLAAIPAGSARRRASAVVVLACAGSFMLLCLTPVSFHSVERGVVWPSEHALVRPLTEGFVQQLLVRDGDTVAAGEVLVVLDDPLLRTERRTLQTQLEQLHAARFDNLFATSEESGNAEEKIMRVEGDLQRVEQRIEHFNVRAGTAGTVVIPRQADLAGTFARQGTALAYVIGDVATHLRVAVRESDGVLLREDTSSVEVRLADSGRTAAGRLVRDLPAATHELPSAALGDRGGGSHPTDRADESGTHAREPVVLVDVELPSETLRRIGSRAWVRFEHRPQPLAQRWYRELRKVLLRHFNAAG